MSVPEPSTLTLFAIGLAWLGFMMRRRRSTAAQGDADYAVRRAVAFALTRLEKL